MSQSSILTRESELKQLTCNIEEFIKKLSEQKRERKTPLGFYNYQINFVQGGKEKEEGEGEGEGGKGKEHKKRSNLRKVFRKEKSRFVAAVQENRERILKLEQFVYQSQSPNASKQPQFSIMRSGSDPFVFGDKKGSVSNVQA